MSSYVAKPSKETEVSWFKAERNSHYHFIVNIIIQNLRAISEVLNMTAENDKLTETINFRRDV